jgi:adenosylmethionine-8-amino-7-oxononanoate aminotransferase
MPQLLYWEPSENKKTVTKTDGYWIHYKDEVEPCLDLTTGYGAFLLGYNNKTILDAIYNLDVQFLRGNNADVGTQSHQLAELICSRGDWASVAWAVSGSDGVEAAMFMNDRYWHLKGKYRPKIISFFPGYHGATFLSRHMRNDYPEVGRATVIQSPQWHTTDQQEEAEAQAIAEVRRILENDTSKDYGCLVMETSPWINDMCPWSHNWWKQIRSICSEYGILFILDDVAVCWGKHGTWFGYEPFGVKPDICVMGKALTGGYSPLSAAACNQEIADVLSEESFDYGHTWQPNMWGVAAALAVSSYIEEHNLLKNVAYINRELKSIAAEHGLVSRGDYLFVIMETPFEVTLGDLHDAGLSSGLPTAGASTGHIKFCAPLIADEEYFSTLRARMKRLFANKYSIGK